MIEATDKNIDIWSKAVDKAWKDLTEVAREFWEEEGVPFEYGEEYMWCEHGLVLDSYMWFEFNLGENHYPNDDYESEEAEIKDVAWWHIDTYIGEIAEYYKKDLELNRI